MKAHWLVLFLSLFLIASIWLAVSCGGSSSGGGGGGQQEMVTLTAPAQAVVGETIQMIVKVDSAPAGIQYLLERVNIDKTVWQNDKTFAMVFEGAGDFSFVADVKWSGGAASSKPVAVSIIPGDYPLTANEDAVQAKTTQTAMFYVNTMGDSPSSVTLKDVTNGIDYTMYDDGQSTHGDLQAGDGIYSCTITKSFPEGTTIFHANVEIGGIAKQTNFFNLLSVILPSSAEIEAVNQDIATIGAYFASHISDVTVDQFIQSFPEQIPGTTEVKSVAKSDDYIDIGFITGQRHVLDFIDQNKNRSAGMLFRRHLSGSFFARGGQASKVTRASGGKGNNDAYIRNYNALIYSSNYQNRQDSDDGYQIHRLLEADSRFQPAWNSGASQWLTDNAVTVDSLTIDSGYNWGNYGVVVYFGHGNANQFFTGEHCNYPTSLKYIMDSITGVLVTEDWIDWDLLPKNPNPCVFAVTGGWLGRHNNTWFDTGNVGTFFYTGSCYGGLAMSALVPAPFGSAPSSQVGSALFGWSNDTLSDINQKNMLPQLSIDLFTKLLAGNSLSDSYNPYWNADPGTNKALSIPVVLGNPDLNLSVSDSDDDTTDDDDTSGSTWTDPTSGLTWQVTPSSDYMYAYDAMLYCDGLTLAGGGWHVPTISELRSLIRGCDGTVTCGSCELTDDCLDRSCWSDPCDGCDCLAGPGSGGAYWPDGMSGEISWYWSSSEVADYASFVWIVSFEYGRIRLNFQGNSNSYVRCVR